MASDNSFDVVSKVEIQEVKNAIDQASQRGSCALRPEGLEVQDRA